MTKVLLIETSPRGSDSVSKKAGRHLIEQLRKKGPIEIVELDLQKENLPHVDSLMVSAYFTPPDQLTAEQKKSIERSDRLVDDLLATDVVVISTPMWNFGIPSTLKAWIDHVSRAGKTFKFTEQGLVGMLKGKKVYVVVSSGSVFSAGAFQTFDHVAPYFKSVFGFMGVLDVELVRVEGTNTPDGADRAYSNAVAAIEAL